MTRRLVFGRSLSDDDAERVRSCSSRGVCSLYAESGSWMNRGAAEANRDMERFATAKRCASCRYRTHCSLRRDDRADALAITEENARLRCQSGTRCNHWPYCGHGKER